MGTHHIVSRAWVVGLCLVITSQLFTGTSVLAAGPRVQVDFSQTEVERPKVGTIEYLEAAVPGITPNALATIDEVTAPAAIMPMNQGVYQTYRHGNWDIYLVDGNGQRTRLTTNTSSDVQPRLTEQINRIVYAARVENIYTITSMDLSGGSKRQMTDTNGHSIAPAWSPDGKKIVYQHVHNGQYDLVVMDEFGNGKTYLTSTTSYEGEPDWSPDGSKIVYVSNVSGGYGIWVMNSNGTNKVLLAGQPYASVPVWSPDGTQIAYSADADGNGFYDLWVMNANGTNQHEVAHSWGNVDIIAAGWNPAGNAILYSGVHWVLYYGQWYWDTANISLYDLIEAGGAEWLFYSAEQVEWNADWQSLDKTPPVTSITAPPMVGYIEPINIYLSDSGAGVDAYQVQYRDSPEGPWYFLSCNWMCEWWDASMSERPFYNMTNGGDERDYRVRARDKVGWIEAWPATPDVHVMMENLPPETSFKELPTLSVPQFTVTWQGYDPGNSNIKSYDVQYRDGLAGNWTAWKTGVTYTQADFSGTKGHIYYFRVRAIDRVNNLEDWPAEEEVPSVAVYSWKANGDVVDNGGAPVYQAEVITDPDSYTAESTDLDGMYETYVITNTPTYSITWHKPGYGMLPETSFPSTANGQLSLVLPPEDNLLQNSHFEEDTLETGWLVSGELTPTLTQETFHTGDSALRLAPWEESVYTSTLIAENASTDGTIMTRDFNDRLHLIWHDFSGQLWYAQQLENDTFTDPEPVGITTINGQELTTIVDSQGTLHLLWRNWSTPNLKYVSRNHEGIWSQEINLGTMEWLSQQVYNLQIDPQGKLYVTWLRKETIGYQDNYQIWYTERDLSGAWLPAQRLPGTTSCTSAILEDTIITDNWGNLHVTWRCYTGSYPTYYTFRSSSGAWKTMEVPDAVPEYLSLDENGNPFWLFPGNGIYYRYQLNSSGTLGARQSITGLPWHGYEFIGVKGKAHYAMVDGIELYLYQLHANGTATDLKYPAAYQHNSVIVQNKNGNLFIFWSDGTGFIQLIRYQGNGNWVQLESIPTFSLDLYHSVKQVAEDNVPFLFHNVGGLNYVHRTRTPQTGSSIIEQFVILPPAMANPILSMLYMANEPFDDDGHSFKIDLTSGETITTIFQTDQHSDGWQHLALDLSAWASQAVTLTFSASQTQDAYPLWVYLDEVTLGTGRPDLWVHLPESFTLLPGLNYQFNLGYGNRSVVSETNAQITLTLPISLTILNASLPYSITGTTAQEMTLTWNFDELTANSESEIVLQVTASDPRLPPTQMPVTLQISAGLNEIETANNAQSNWMWFFTRILLPLLLRN